MKTPPIASPEEWNVAREELLDDEKELTRAGDALAAQRRRMPWMEVDNDYRFEGPAGRVRPAIWWAATPVGGLAVPISAL